MKSINIKGKNYVMVNDRIKFFRENEKYAGWSLTSELINLTEDSCVIKAIVTNTDGFVVATGFAQEDRTSSMINKTSFVENCETSAWGRALGNLGIGIDDSIASAEEVDMAIKKQEVEQSLKLKCEKCGKDLKDNVAKFSKSKFGKELCFDCQNIEKNLPVPEKEI
jgi:ssDNA-binding Zn-finger/Zn-ribbon topoisomerase 1